MVKFKPIFQSKFNRRTRLKRRRVTLKRLTVAIFVLVAMTVIVVGFVFFPLKASFVQAQNLIVNGRGLSAAIKNQNLDEAENELVATKANLKKLDQEFAKIAFLKYIPIINAYYNDGQHFLSAGDSALSALAVSLETIKPYADLLGFKGKSTFVSGSANERIHTAVVTMDKLTPRLADISVHIEKVQKEFNGVDINRYPEAIGGEQIRSNIKKVKDLVDDVSALFIKARPLLEQLPSILGEPKAKTYLVLFQNDKELRPTGGFITAYALFRLENGKPVVLHSDDIYELDKKAKLFDAPPEILKYHKKVYYLYLRDSNLSPDFKTSMEKFEEIYNTVPGKTDIDGIIAVDTHVLVEALKILGPISIDGKNFTTENNPRCNCPDVIYELEEYADKPVAYERGSRKDIIGVLLYQIMQKALGVSPSAYWPQLLQMILQEVQQKHILAYFHDPKTQNAAEVFDMAGKIKEYSGDYLHINDTNFAGAKSNMFVNEYVSQKIEIAQDGSITETVVVDYKNPSPPSDCGLESGGLCLNGILRNWVRFYVPKGSKLLEFKGSEMETEVLQDLDKTVFSAFLTVRPLGTAQISVKYLLPFRLKSGEEYKLLIQKQPGTQGHEWSLFINNKLIEKFPLSEDKELMHNI